MAAYSGCWSELPLDLIVLIFSRLELVDFNSAAAACRSWRQLKSRSKDFHVRPKNQIPWLMLSSPSPFQSHSRYFHNLLPSSDAHQIHLPEVDHLFCIGSSQGFLISVDQSTADLRAVNPVTGARIPLPPTSTFPGINFPSSIFKFQFEFGKAILSPDPGFGSRPRTAAIIYSWNLAFAQPGDGKWTLLANSQVCDFDDILFHKNRLYAANWRGALAVFDLRDLSIPHSILCEGLSHEDLHHTSKCYLLESPDGHDLYYVTRLVDHFLPTNEYDDHFHKTTRFWVYILDELERKWIEVKNLGDLALFLGSNSLALSAKEHPSIKRNSIYFTDNSKECSFSSEETATGIGAYDLEDGSIQPLSSGDDICCFNWPPPIWFTPSLS